MEGVSMFFFSKWLTFLHFKFFFPTVPLIFIINKAYNSFSSVIAQLHVRMSYREDICLQTSLLLFKYANHKNKRSFVSTTNEALVGIFMTIGDVNELLTSIARYNSDQI